VASLNQLGEVLARRGDRGGAVLALRRSLDLKPDQPAAQALLDRLVAGGS
jgi:cytochrome c-type biogenesis protein CcmH/NrfG